MVAETKFDGIGVDGVGADPLASDRMASIIGLNNYAILKFEFEPYVTFGKASHSFLVLANLVQTQNIEFLKSNKNPSQLMDYESTLFKSENKY